MFMSATSSHDPAGGAYQATMGPPWPVTGKLGEERELFPNLGYSYFGDVPPERRMGTVHMKLSEGRADPEAKEECYELVSSWAGHSWGTPNVSHVTLRSPHQQIDSWFIRVLAKHRYKWKQAREFTAF